MFTNPSHFIQAITPPWSLKRGITILVISSILQGCGGGESSTNTTSQTPPIDPTPTQPSEPSEPNNDNTIVAFDYSQKANNQTYRSGQVQSPSFVNTTGQFRLPIAGQNLSGNITIAVDVADPDGISNVYVGFEGTAMAELLCSGDCGTEFHTVVTGINPIEHHLNDGAQRLTLWSEDTQGNRVWTNTVEFNWHKKRVTGVTGSQSSNNLNLSWQPLSNYLRYNVYIASQDGVTADNYQSLPDGQAFLALKDPSFVLTGNDTGKAYYSSVTAVDGSGESAFSETPLKIAAYVGEVDLPPVAINDYTQTNEATLVTGNALSNDYDPENAPLRAATTLVSQGLNGAAEIDENGNYRYTPIDNFSGRDFFSYQLIDAENQTATGVVIIDIAQTNDNPEASYNSFNLLTTNRAIDANKLAILSRPAPGLLINDLDIDGNTITVNPQPISGPNQGTLILNTDGSFTYDSNPGASGEDQFTYQTLDGNGGTAQATVRITIDGDNFFPIAANDHYSLNAGETLTVDNSTAQLRSILANDEDLDPADTLEVSDPLVRNVTNGTLNISADGTFTYTPNVGFYGIDSFIYEVKDDKNDTAQAAAIITVARVNQSPTATNDSYTSEEDLPLVINAINGILSNDIDLDQDDLTITLLQPPNNGELTLNSDGSFEYQPDQDFFGLDSFSYQINDGQGGIDNAVVEFNLTAINDAPVANDDTAQGLIDTEMLIDVLANDTDAEGDPLEITNVDNPDTRIESNLLKYNPPAGFIGSVVIGYTITDGLGGSDSAVVNLTVGHSNQEPVGNNDSYSLSEDQVLIINQANGLLNNDSDSDGDQLSVNPTPFTNTSNGTLSLNADGSFNYQPDNNFFGNDSFVYQLLDGEGGSDTATVNLTIASVNDAPNANDDSFTTAEETLINLNVLANDTDVENDSLTVVTASANHGEVTVLNDNSINYTPAQDFFGSDTLNYQITDGNGGSGSAQVSLNVLNVNDLPVANNDTAITDENTPVAIDVLANDSDIDGDPLSVLTATTSQGGVVINSNNTLVYTPANNFNGNATINYTLSDDQGGTDTAIVIVEVIAVNDDPVAQNDQATTEEDTPVLIDVLQNDTDIDGDTLELTSASADNGSVTITDNQLNYQPNDNFNGTDLLSYQISDLNGGSASAEVTITITAINDNPVAMEDLATTNEDTLILLNVLANDNDIDNPVEELSISAAIATHGIVSIDLNNQLVYQPNQDFNGVDNLTYQLVDIDGGSAIGNVIVTVVAQNDLPLALNDSASTDEDNSVTITVLDNDSDIDGDPLTVTSAVAALGSVLINNDHSLSYTPNQDVHGQDSIEYQINDGQGGIASAIVTVTINPINDDPVANDDSASTDEDNSITFTVLDNDSDIDGDLLTITSATAAQGSVIINNDNSLTYNPEENFNGQDNIEYSVSDGQGGSAFANVAIIVEAVNDDPIAVDDTATTNEDSSVTFAILNNDSDLDGDNLTVIAATASQGQVSINASNSLTYSPNENFNGQDNIQYTISDGQGSSDSALVTVTVNPVNDQPSAEDDSATAEEDLQITVDVLTNDSDIDGDSLTIVTATVDTTAAGTIPGSVSIENNQLVFNPDTDYNGDATVVYEISDGLLTSNAKLLLTITPINDPPVAVADSGEIDEDQTQFIDVISNDYDVDGDELSILDASAINGQVAVQSDNQIKYAPNPNFNGTDTISYSLSDGSVSITGTATVTVKPINDPPVATADSATTDEDLMITINVLDNDSDVDGDELKVTEASAEHGSVTIESDYSINYTPDSDHNGDDLLSYTLSDGSLTTTGNVGITVNSINDDPVAVSDSIETDEDTMVSIDILKNDYDVDGDLLDIDSATADYGTVTITDAPALEYTPDPDYNGADVISYQIRDNNGGTATSMVTVSINPINDHPQTHPDSATTDEDTLINIDVLSNDSDIDGDSLIVSSATADNGSVTIKPDNTLDYTPDHNYNGSDAISYIISDGEFTASASVTVTINPIADLPIVDSDTITTDEDTVVNIDILVNDSDPDGGSLTITAAALSANNGTVTLMSDDTIDYLPDSNFNGVDTINYEVTNATGSASTTVTVTVNAINDPPTVADDSGSIAENSGNESSVLTMSATDPDSDATLTFHIQSDESGIFAIDGGTGEITISDNSNLNYESQTSHTLTIKVEDQHGGFDTALATITVTDVEETVTPTIDGNFSNNPADDGIVRSNAFGGDSFDKSTDSIIDANGKLIVIGHTYEVDNYDITLTRFNTDGSIDRDFGYQGLVSLDLGFDESPTRINIDANGKIVVAGMYYNESNADAFVARFNADGGLDKNFNNPDGYVATNDGTTASVGGVEFDASNNIYVGTTYGVAAARTQDRAPAGGFRLLSYTDDGTDNGSVDATFESSGDQTTNLLKQSNGSLVMTGSVYAAAGHYNFGAARFDVSASAFLDTSYGNNGIVNIDFGEAADDKVYDAMLDGNDNLVIVGGCMGTSSNYADMCAIQLDTDGALVSGFGVGGLLVEDIDGDTDGNTSESIARSITTDSSGLYYFGIDNGRGPVRNAIYKTNTNGVVQSSYGSSGLASLSHGNYDNLIANIVVDNNDNILMASTTDNNNQDILVARVTSAGSVDSTYGYNGYNQKEGAFSADILNEMIELKAGSNAGKFVAVGTTNNGGGTVIIVARYTAAGALDESFGYNGYYIHRMVEVNLQGNDIAEQSDGKLVIAGHSFDSKGFALRLNVDGSLDTNFASAGEYTLSGGSDVNFNAVAIDGNDKIILAGSYTSGDSDVKIVRLNTDGSLDNNFDNDGIFSVDLGLYESLEDIAIQSDNAIVGVGKQDGWGLIIRVLENGSLDTANFAPSAGFIAVDLDPDSNANDDILRKVALKSDGTIVAAGESADAVASNALVQLSSTGILDSNFDTDGIVRHNYGAGEASTFDLALDSQERLITTGFNSNGTDKDIFVARVTATGVKDTMFNTTGGELIDHASDDKAKAIVVTSDGSLVYAGDGDLGVLPASSFFLQKLLLIEP